jgi:hypothetical protein
MPNKFEISKNQENAFTTSQIRLKFDNILLDVLNLLTKKCERLARQSCRVGALQDYYLTLQLHQPVACIFVEPVLLNWKVRKR